MSNELISWIGSKPSSRDVVFFLSVVLAPFNVYPVEWVLIPLGRSLFYWGQQKGKRNNKLSVLCASNERSEWAFNK